MTEPITKEQLVDASADAQTLEDVVNGTDTTDVTSRLERTYPTLAKALRLIVENGLLGATPFNLKSQLDASALANDAYAIVTDDPTLDSKGLPANNGFYQKRSGVWEFLRWNPLTQAIADRKSVIDTDDVSMGLQLIVDGFVIAQIVQGLFSVAGLPLIRDVAGVAEFLHGGKVLGRLGAKPEWGGVTFDGGKIELGDTTLSESADPSFKILADGFVIFDSATIGSGGTTPAPAPDNTPVDLSKPLFGNVLCGWPNDSILLSVPDLTPHRTTQDASRPILATIASKTTGYTRSSRDILSFEPSKLSNPSTLVLRDTRQSALRTAQTIAVHVAQAGGGQASKILMFGDSIIHGSHAPDILNPILVAQGYSPVWVGTMTTTGGRKHEAHSGIETTDFTARDLSKYDPVAVGGEAAYLVSPSPNGFNPCIRAAVGGDPAGDVFNGYIFDASFYQTRFSLATPDVVLIALGTNNIRDRSEPALSTNFYDDLRIMISSCRAAWPNAQILITITPTAASADRDALWPKYVGVIEKLKQLIADRADSKLKLVPAWAHVCNEVGYPMSAGTPDTLGAVTAGLSDSIHPFESARFALWQTMSAYLACAAKNYS